MNQSQQLFDPSILLGFADASDAQRISNVLADIQVRKEREGLEHHAEITPVRRNGRDVRALDENTPGTRDFKAGDHPQQRGFSAAGRAEQTHECTLRHIQIDLLDRRNGTKVFRNPVENETGHRNSG